MECREDSMLGCIRVSAVVRLAAIAAALAICAGAQNLPSTPMLVPGIPAIGPGTFGGQGPFTVAVIGTGAAAIPISATPPDPTQPPRGPRRITLEQVKQSANRAAMSLQRLAMLSVEAARQHRLGAQADYFPKFGATFWNLHTTDFLGQIVTVRRPILGVTLQAPIQIVNQDQTAAILSVVQPITPILQVHEAVKIARADERIAAAKAGAAGARNARNSEVEEAYFELLIAQRQLISAESKLRSGESRPLYAGASIGLVRASEPTAELVEDRKGVESAAATVRERTATLNRMMGWPEETELDLEMPDPLVENISLQDVSDKPVAANPDLVEAEQTVVKARAAAKLSKLAYVPTVAAVSGYAFQNVLPAVRSNFGYGGVMASYTLFDFGKREHAVKEAHAQLEMAEIGLQAAKAKSAADLKKSYYELERSRQLSNVAQRMASSAALLINAGASTENLQVRAGRAEMELEMLQADLAHRQAFARLKGLMGEMR
jgi:outer membrane protein TolC